MLLGSLEGLLSLLAKSSQSGTLVAPAYVAANAAHMVEVASNRGLSLAEIGLLTSMRDSAMDTVASSIVREHLPMIMPWVVARAAAGSQAASSQGAALLSAPAAAASGASAAGAGSSQGMEPLAEPVESDIGAVVTALREFAPQWRVSFGRAKTQAGSTIDAVAPSGIEDGQGRSLMSALKKAMAGVVLVAYGDMLATAKHLEPNGASWRGVVLSSSALTSDMASEIR